MSMTQKNLQVKSIKKLNFTDVQVRIHNKAYNYKKALVVSKDDLLPYINKIREESKDSHGRRNWKQFAHLPLVSFVDPDEQEEVVYKSEKDLPIKPTEIKTSKGILIAQII